MDSTLVFGLCGVAAVFVVALLQREKTPIDDLPPCSPDWLVENERRNWSSGVEQSCVKEWPIRTNASGSARPRIVRIQKRDRFDAEKQ